MKTILIIATLIVMSCTTNVTVVQPTTRIDSRVVIVRSMTGSGAGLLLGELVVTCNHVVSPGPITIEYADGSKGIATLLKTSEEHDLALLGVTNSHGSKPIKVGAIQVPGTPCHAIGHPVAGDYSYTEGDVSFGNIQIGKSARTLCRMQIDFGYSGGPCFTNTNEFVGIVSAMYKGTPYTLVIPAHIVVKFVTTP